MQALTIPLHRRHACLWLALAATGCKPFAASSQHPLSEEDKALKHKFRGLNGGELFVDAITEKIGVNIFNEKGHLFYSSATLSLRNNSRHAYGATFGVPKTLRVQWRDSDEHMYIESITNAYRGGTILGDYTVPVASRIPDDVLDFLRNKGGQFRLKIRIHDDGPLIGWDIATGLQTYFAGGDFREARMVYEGDPQNPTQRREKGWYIHPKTGQKIETPF